MKLFNSSLRAIKEDTAAKGNTATKENPAIKGSAATKRSTAPPSSHIPAKAGIPAFTKMCHSTGWLRHVMPRNDKNGERGAVFVYILLAIALLAALSYAVSRGGRGNMSTLTDQQAKLAAQEIIEYGNTVANAVQKLKLRGCSDTEISFENATYAGYTNASAPSDKSCHVFDINGGNINMSLMDDTVFDLKNNYHSVGRDKIIVNAENILEKVGNANETELIYFTPAVKENICSQINKTLGLGNVNFDSTDFSVGIAKYTGVFYSGSTVAHNICPSTILSGKTQGCCHETLGCDSGDCYHYYQVLIAR